MVVIGRYLILLIISCHNPGPNPGREVSHQCEKHLGRIPPAGGGRQLSGGRYEIGHLPRGRRPPGPNYAEHWGMEMTFWEDKKRDQMDGVSVALQKKITSPG